MTLDASVKIYGSRVDSVHTIAFQTLSGLSRSAAVPVQGAQPEKFETPVRQNALCITFTAEASHQPLDDATDGGAEASTNGEETSTRAGPAKEAKHSSPSSTLESSFEALNVKKFDLTFAMDPLFRRTSAQFDEGGAQGAVSQVPLPGLFAGHMSLHRTG